MLRKALEAEDRKHNGLANGGYANKGRNFYNNNNNRYKKKPVPIICQGPPPAPVKLLISQFNPVNKNVTNMAVKASPANSVTGWKLLTSERGTVGFEYARQTTAALLAYFRDLSTSAINPLEYHYAPQSDVQVGATYESKVRGR